MRSCAVPDDFQAPVALDACVCLSMLLERDLYPRLLYLDVLLETTLAVCIRAYVRPTSFLSKLM